MSEKPKAKRNNKNSVFCSLFSNKENAIELYNALAGTNYGPNTDITINTLSDVLFLNQINDLSFTIDGRTLVLIEHQSSLFPNLPIRMLIYAGRLYESILTNKNLYSSKAVKIPAPEFYVLYNGKLKLPEVNECKLSDLFIHPTDALELKVKILDIKYDKANQVIHRSKHLKGYSFLMAQIVYYDSSGLELDTAITKAMENCIEKGYIVNYLNHHGSEVLNMITKNISMEEYGDIRWEDGREDGREEGFFAGISKVVMNMFTNASSINDIIAATGLDKSEIEEIKRKWEEGQ